MHIQEGRSFYEFKILKILKSLGTYEKIILQFNGVAKEIILLWTYYFFETKCSRRYSFVFCICGVFIKDCHSRYSIQIQCHKLYDKLFSSQVNLAIPVACLSLVMQKMQIQLPRNEDLDLRQGYVFAHKLTWIWNCFLKLLYSEIKSFVFLFAF